MTISLPPSRLPVWLLHLPPRVAPRAGQAPPLPPNRVTVSYPLERNVADYVEFTGQTSAVKTVEVRARVWGYLESLHFTEGALVKQGDLLFQIDPRPYKALVDQAKGKIGQDNAQLKHNEATYRRYEKLRANGAATQEDLDRVLADRDAMKATLAADTADLEAKQLDLDYTTIRSPITGRVSRFEVTEGNVVQSGQNGGTLLTTIVSVDPMYVYFDVDERTLLQVRRLIGSGCDEERAGVGFSDCRGAGGRRGFSPRRASSISWTTGSTRGRARCASGRLSESRRAVESRPVLSAAICRWASRRRTDPRGRAGSGQRPGAEVRLRRQRRQRGELPAGGDGPAV